MPQLTNGWDFQPDHALLDPNDRGLEPPDNFAACLNAHGMYETMRFVLRLSPRNHYLIDSVTTGIYSTDDISQEALQAYATYLHETVHWWQHAGSTSGLLYSLSYLGQSHSSLSQLRDVVQLGGKKPLKKWADNALLHGTAPSSEILSAANIAVNNAIDVEFYKQYAMLPNKAEDVVTHQNFESVGHCYYVVYGHLLGMLSDTIDPEFKALPDMRAWEAPYASLRNQQHIGFYHGSPVYRARVGIHAIFEGQARFIQLQFLNRAARQSPTCQEWRDKGFLSGVYVDAFEEFLRLSKSEWPPDINHPVINLFLLICDLSINPTRGLPLDIVSFENFIEDVDVGARFTHLSSAVQAAPELRDFIRTCSRDEYAAASARLTTTCGYDHPFKALRAIGDWIEASTNLQALMLEHQTFDFGQVNQPVRVLFSHFVAFCRDKLKRPEFFCWPGVWLTGSRANTDIQEIFLRHLSLFSDRGDKPGVYPRNWPNRNPELVQATFDRFYGNIILYDLVRQWILQDGPFRYEYSWLTQAVTQSELEAWANGIFSQQFGLSPAAFEILT